MNTEPTSNGDLAISNPPAEYTGGDVVRPFLVTWLTDMVPNLRLPLDATDEDIRSCLIDGTVLCTILSKLSPGILKEGGGVTSSDQQSSGNLKRFLAAMDELGLPKFGISDLQQGGSMKKVFQCLWTIKTSFSSDTGTDTGVAKSGNQPRKKWIVSQAERLEGTNGGDISPRESNSAVSGDERRKPLLDSKFQRALRSPIMSETPAAMTHHHHHHHVGHKFHEVFQLKQGRYADLPPAKISEMLKSNSLDNAPTQSLLSVVNGILDESIDRKNGEIPHRVACLLRKVVQEIERRISTQAEHIRAQNNMYKAREEKYQSRIRVLETLATGTSDETQIAVNKLQQIKTEKFQMEEKKKLEEQDMDRLLKEKDHTEQEIVALKKDLEKTKNMYEQQCQQLETQSKETQVQLEERLKELEHLLSDSRKKEKELETFSQSKSQSWNKKELTYHGFIDFQFKALQELRRTSSSIKEEVASTHNSYLKEFNRLGEKLKGLADAAQNYHTVIEENRRLYNEVQDLKGNIRVYCRIRPFIHGQNKKQTTVEYIGDNGELVIVNPSKQGKESQRMFKFDKVFGPAATQEEVFLDTQPLIRSVLDGFNVCIFAYGQTGSGKTYTMAGPEGASKENWGVNYRALNDLFHISQTRKNSFIYEVGVQMVEIYNEQVRDLLSNDSSQKRLGIWTSSQPNGLAVPDASMHPVKSTKDVLELMQIGHTNRAVGATAMNLRSSRSHSTVTVHVRGTDLETGAALRGSLHLVDLAGSERVDRSEATGDRLKEAQHINKSLSALGDVIFALAQKSSHVPYRNSKLTQVLQSSLGGQAKTLMFVQLNPDTNSYSESLSTLKFAERVSGVELGAAKSNKEGRDVRELMEQVASLKDTIAKKDEEIERLQLLKDLRTVPSNVNGEKRSVSSLRNEFSSPSSVGASQRGQRLSGGKGSGLLEKAVSDQDNCSENSDKQSEAGSQQSMEDFRHKDFFRQSKLAVVDTNQEFSADDELLGFGEPDSEERLSDISDGGLSVGTETDGSVEFTLIPDGSKPAESTEKSKVTKIPRPLQTKQGQTTLSRPSSAKDLSKVSSSKSLPKVSSSKDLSKVSSVKKITVGSTSSSSSANSVKRWQ